MTIEAPLHVVVLIDAFGWHLAERLDFMRDVLPYRAPLKTVLGYSSAAIPTMLTGKAPAGHGHWNLFYYDPGGSPFRWMRGARRLPEPLINNRYTRKALKEFGRRVLGLGQLFDCFVSPSLLPQFNWVERRNIYEPGGISGGPSVFDELTTSGIPYHVYTYHRYRDDDILARARRDVSQSRARFFFIYLSEIDAFLHVHCDDTALVERTFRKYEQGLRELLDIARARDPRAGFTVLSDHGMTPVRHHCDLASQLDTLKLRMPDDYLAVHDSTMARFWFFSDAARDRIVDLLSRFECGHILTDENLRELDIRFDDRRYGDLVFLMEPGWLISSSDFTSGAWMPAGMHGYHPDDPYSDAIFLSRLDPARPMRTIADAHGFMREAAGLPGATVPSTSHDPRAQSHG